MPPLRKPKPLTDHGRVNILVAPILVQFDLIKFCYTILKRYNE